ncbi:hypothetical protein M8J77_019882 [Diaphorina citri]|nr:hypothetical protein M8J77_019882 [Diaphorina citri]
MADTAPAIAAPSAETPKGKGKKATAAAKKPKAVPAHPPTAEMVTKAIGDLKEKGGSSLIAIKKFIGSTYKVDAQKLAPFIRKYLVSAVAAGKLVQTKGKGASGSFKLAIKEKAPKPAAKPKKEKAPKKKTAAAAKPKKTPAAKKPKAAATKKTSAAAAPAAKKPKTPTKAKATKPTKKAAKSPSKKAPKPKKIAATKKAAPKKK